MPPVDMVRKCTKPAPLEALQAWMIDDALPLWARAGWDDVAESFVEQLDHAGTPMLNISRRAMVQARQIFVYATAQRRGWHPAAGALACRAGETMIRQYWRTGGQNGWAFSADRAGHIVDGRRDLYTQAFALLALASLYRQTGSAVYADLAKSTLDFLDQAMAGRGGGYIDSLPARTGPTPGLRRQNSHMHLLEALLAWHEAAPALGALSRATQLIELFEDRFVAFRGPAERAVLVEYFHDDWSAQDITDPPFEPGHHFEWVWLLAEYARLSGSGRHALAAPLWDAAIRHGFDDRGLIVDAVTASGQIASSASRLWPHAEAMKAFSTNPPLTANAPYHDAATVCQNLQSRFLAPAHRGSWLEHLDGNGVCLRSTAPASTLYHLACALDRCLPAEGEKGPPDKTPI
jgi:mannose/cellobiose epimerase-like protein (N-acyl-D-glucosamine 2-epimerase family)